MSLTVASCFLDLILSVIPARRSDLKYLTLIRMTKDEKGLAFFKGLLL